MCPCGALKERLGLKVREGRARQAGVSEEGTAGNLAAVTGSAPHKPRYPASRRSRPHPGIGLTFCCAACCLCGPAQVAQPS